MQIPMKIHDLPIPDEEVQNTVSGLIVDASLLSIGIHMTFD